MPYPESSSSSSSGAEETEETLHKLTCVSELPSKTNWSWNLLYLTDHTLVVEKEEGGSA